ncbi:MAG: peptidyl-alpha-hydroxyglycine alpha-amidating lyase family protein [Gemmatimonadaceae bacterium]
MRTRSNLRRSRGASSVTGALRAALLLALVAGTVSAQTMVPVNDRPNPYRTVEGWAKMPEGRTWGSTSAVAIDRDGVSIWVGERCGQNNCVGSDLDPILKFDAHGNLVKAFGRGLIAWPHGMTVDHDGNVWVTDARDNSAALAAAAGQGNPIDSTKLYGHQLLKFSPEGELLMRLGARGGGREQDYFWQPNAVLVAPNGDIWVAEGHSSQPTANARIFKFDRAGTLLLVIGRKGTGPDEFDQPHALAMDSRGRLFVGDRSNNRIQIYDQQGTLLDTWYQFSRASGLFIDANDTIYVADSESGSVAPTRPEWKRGIRIGSARTGEVTAFIPDPVDPTRGTSAAEGVAVDRNGVIYGAEVGPRALKRYERIK